MQDWFDHILFHMRAQPETPALVTEGRIVTYGMLRAGIDRCAGHIAGLESFSETPTAVVVADPILHLTLCLALIRCGISSMSLDLNQISSVDMPFANVLGDAAAKAAVEPKHRVVDIDGWFRSDAPGTQGLPVQVSSDRQACRLHLTSGSTGAPKVVKLTVEDIGRRTEALIHFNWKRVLCLPGLASTWAFRTACGTLAGGGTLFFSASPFQSIRLIELFAVEYLMAATEQLLAVSRVARTKKARLSSLRLVETAGGVMTNALLEAAITYVCRDTYCRYGASEIGAVARAPAREVLSRPGYTGHVLPGVELAIVDREGKLCPAGTVGLIRCRRSVAFGEPAAWFDLGDLGMLTTDGELFVIGRASDIAALGGQDTALRQMSLVQEAEHLLRLEWDASDAAAAAIGNSNANPLIGIGIVDCSDANAEKLETIMRARGFDCAIRLFPMKSIPRLAGGKINRTQLQTLMLSQAGQIQTLSAPHTIRPG